MDNRPTQAIDALLHSLRSRIRRYVVWEGTAASLAVVGAIFWLSLGLDYWLELARGWRAVLLLATATLFCVSLAAWVLLRVARSLSNRSLALVLERRFPALNDRLITGVELGGAAQSSQPELTRQLIDRAVNEVVQLASTLELKEVFNPKPLARASLLASGLVGSIVAFGCVFGDTMQLWFKRNVLLAEEYWPRETDLKVTVIAEPGQREVEFTNGVYKHPRGADFMFRATVVEGRKVPDNVQYRIHFTDRSARSRMWNFPDRDYMSKVGQRQYKHTLAGLHESLDMYVRGGDFSNREPYRVEVVDAPRIDRLELASLFPAYTGKNLTDDQTGQPTRTIVPVQGTQVSLPAGTNFIINAVANKPLVEVGLRAESFEVRLTRDDSTITFISKPASGETANSTGGQTAGATASPLEKVEHSLGKSLLAADGLSWSLPCLLSTKLATDDVPDGSDLLPLLLPPDVAWQITLTDADGITTAEPLRLTINSRTDEAPRIEAQLKGIGNSITRQALIPITGLISDDYGVWDARFEYQADANGEFAHEAFVKSPQKQAEFQFTERFDVLPHDLKIGQRFVLTVTAADGDDLTGPHRTVGSPFVFQVVSNDELLALIAAKELFFRRRFEQVLEEVKETRKDLGLQRAKLDEAYKAAAANAASSGPQPNSDDVRTNTQLAAGAAVERASHGSRKSANELLTIEQSFRDIRDELEHNRLPDNAPRLERLDNGILRPLHGINTTDYNQLADYLELLKQAVENHDDPRPRLEQTHQQLDVIIQHMEQVLSAMLKLETFNEALELLRGIIKESEDIQQKTKNERKKKLIEGLQ
ncbi:MAG: hypothetical protein HZA46_19730 [Planctomycetales bacterium]|nr:hypothetical protein [Planctomycetales bacterium]